MFNHKVGSIVVINNIEFFLCENISDITFIAWYTNSKHFGKTIVEVYSNFKLITNVFNI